MDIRGIAKNLENCVCGRDHAIPDVKVEIGRGLINKVPEILESFPRNLLVVADKNTLNASPGIMDILQNNGFSCSLKLYDDFRTADMVYVKELTLLSNTAEAVFCIGSGSLGDVCRMASFQAEKPLALFATAPSMDGFASSSAPLTENGFKKSYLCHIPQVIIGDTDILAAAPQILKSAGFGDMVAKYLALVEWKIANLTIGEYICPNVYAVTKTALDKTMALADKIVGNSTDAAGALMEGLVLSGLAMAFASVTRPASGAEHIVSHFWEIKEMEKGNLPDYHGRKVGVATLLVTRLYHELVEKTPAFGEDTTDWDAVYAAYGPNFKAEIESCNNPTITKNINPEKLAEQWQEICKIVKEGLPSYNEMLALMKKAEAAVSVEDIHISHELADSGMKYHAYMRNRINLSRLVPMLGM